jgi:hypothetical protein
LHGHRGGVNDLAAVPGGKMLLSAGSDGTALLWDLDGLIGKEKPVSLAAEDLDTLWQDLGGSDAAKALEAVHRLRLAPEQAVPYFKERLKPVPPADAERIKKLLADLESEQFAVRQKATAELEKLGDLAAHSIREALKGQPPLETRQRLERLLDKAEAPGGTADRLRALRAVAALEQVGTADARALLEALAKGAPGCWVTLEAEGALQRLGRMSKDR